MKMDIVDLIEFFMYFDGFDLWVFMSVQDEMLVDEIGEVLVGYFMVFVGYFGVGKFMFVNVFVLSVGWVIGYVNQVIGCGCYMLLFMVFLCYQGVVGIGWVIDIFGVCLFGFGYVDLVNIFVVFMEFVVIVENCF